MHPVEDDGIARSGEDSDRVESGKMHEVRNAGTDLVV